MMPNQMRKLGWIVGGMAASALVFVPGISLKGNSFAPTFNREVAPILFKHCVNCHRPGEIASALPLLSYDNARTLAQSIKVSAVRRQMPPWPADARNSMKFRNDPQLSQHEIDTLVAWVDAGMPKGNDADLPSLPSVSQGWQHPKSVQPEAVIRLPNIHLPASGEIPYVRYLSKVPFSTDKWVVALQVLPSNRGIVHHMAITEVALDPGVTPSELIGARESSSRSALQVVPVGLEQRWWIRQTMARPTCWECIHPARLSRLTERKAPSW